MLWKGHHTVELVPDRPGRRGSILYVIIELLAVCRASTLKTLTSWAIFAGLVLGFATDKGGKTSHTAIMARALGIPAVVGLVDLTTQIKDGIVKLEPVGV